MVAAIMPVMFYYGCLRGVGGRNEAGHYMYDGELRSAYRWHSPWGAYPDGNLAPQGDQVQGLALLHHKDGWTALSFWDRSGDSRTNSNSNFFAEGDFSFEQMLELMREQFPELMNRFNFTIRQVSV